MSLFSRALLLILAVGMGMFYRKASEMLRSQPVPKLPLDQWWGDEAAPKDWQTYLATSSRIVNNKLSYPEEVIADLRAQLNRTLRLTEPLEGVACEYGFNTNHLLGILEYWRKDYLPRWRDRELFLWQFNHFTTEIQGLRMHFLHLKVSEENAAGRHHYPVLLLHGWPGSVREFYSLIHLLYQTIDDRSNRYIFDVIAPSLPGFAWSQGTSKTGMGPPQIAVIMRNLMLRLGYTKFFIQGGDWGSLIGSHMATLFPENVIGYYSNLCTVMTLKASLKAILANMLPSFFISESLEHLFFPLSEKLSFLIEESGYLHLQATKPDTIGAVLQDNPVGLATYILEKFSTWTNPGNRHLADGGLPRHFELDALLDNVMIYYLTNSITTSQRIYAEFYAESEVGLQLERAPTRVPTGCARFRHDLWHFLDYQLKDKYPNLIHSTYHSIGGHFAAMELPHFLYRDFITFVQKVEKFRNLKVYQQM